VYGDNPHPYDTPTLEIASSGGVLLTAGFVVPKRGEKGVVSPIRTRRRKRNTGKLQKRIRKNQRGKKKKLLGKGHGMCGEKKRGSKEKYLYQNQTRGGGRPGPLRSIVRGDRHDISTT